MQGRLQDAVTTGTTVIAHYQFDAIDAFSARPVRTTDGLVSVCRRDDGPGDLRAAGNLLARQSSPFSLTFAMRRATGALLNVAVLQPKPAADRTRSGHDPPAVGA